MSTLDKHRHLRGNTGKHVPGAKSLKRLRKQCFRTSVHRSTASPSKRARSTTPTSPHFRIIYLRPIENRKSPNCGRPPISGITYGRASERKTLEKHPPSRIADGHISAKRRMFRRPSPQGAPEVTHDFLQPKKWSLDVHGPTPRAARCARRCGRHPHRRRQRRRMAPNAATAARRRTAPGASSRP
jgi:hypothetical protein